MLIDEKILIIDDEENAVDIIKLALKHSGYNNVLGCTDSREAIKLVEDFNISLIILDLWMPNISGQELLKHFSESFPQIPVIIITALNDVRTAVKCIQAGAVDYILKPLEINSLKKTINCVFEFKSIQNENKRLGEAILWNQLKHPEFFDHIVTKNSNMLSVFKYVEAIAQSNYPVLITGESGVGKELIATAIHKCSLLNGHFVPVNIAGLDDTIFSDTLFGHKKGAYTSATQDRDGLIEHAHNGTLFLDEIADLNLNSQIKLLRLIQEGQFYQLGSDTPKESKTRIILATNKDLETLVKEKVFRKDLFYRLTSHHIHLPPLRERKEDIPLLVDFFTDKHSSILKKKKPIVPKELYSLLKCHSFPGNIRELEGMIADALSICTSHVLSITSFKDKIFKDKNTINMTAETNRVTFNNSLPTLKELNDILINEALKRSDNNQSIASRLLGISRRALNNRLSRSKNTYINPN